jgi:RNA-dependent RNA polymerase
MASWLAGGDYNGDKVIAIWEPTIVESFSPPYDRSSNVPDELNDAFKWNTETVGAFTSRVTDLDTESQIRDYYSNFHDSAIHSLGYTHKETLQLAHMFCTVLDGSITGLTVQKEILKKDTVMWQNRHPALEDKEKESKQYYSYNVSYTKCEGNLEKVKCIMDSLVHVGEQE